MKHMSVCIIILLTALGNICGMTDGESTEPVTITLPQPKTDGTFALEKALQERRSIRRFRKDAVSLHQLSQILWAAYGITKPSPGSERLRGGLRTAPSAGGTYPLEILVVAGNVDNLEPGVYRYDSAGHTLDRLMDGDVRVALSKTANGQNFLREAPFCLVYTAIFSRTVEIYGKRGRERYVYMDLGHSAENVYLQATASGLGTVAVGAFRDDDISRLFGLSETEEPLYIMPVGVPE